MHRATQAAMLLKLNDDIEQRSLSFDRVIQPLRENFPDPSMMAKLQIAEAHVWPNITKVLPHILTAILGSAGFEIGSISAHSLRG